jgi:hypothetical protein
MCACIRSRLVKRTKASPTGGTALLSLSEGALPKVRNSSKRLILNNVVSSRMPTDRQSLLHCLPNKPGLQLEPTRNRAACEQPAESVYLTCMQDLATGEVADGPENAQAVKEELTTAYGQTRGPLELQRLNSLPVSGPLATRLIHSELELSEGWESGVAQTFCELPSLPGSGQSCI